MILIKKIILYIYLILSLIFLLALGIAYYKVFMSLFNTQGDELIKYHAENFVFFSVVSVLVLLIVFFVLLNRSRNFYKEIDKIIEISKNSNIEIDEFLKKMGNFGGKINELTKNITNISHLKTLQISSYWNIINTFIEYFSDDLILIAHDGYILNLSNNMFSNIGIEKKDVVKKNISEILKDFNFDEIENNLIASKTPLTIKNINIILNKKKDKIDLTFYPIFNAENNLVFTIASKKEKEVIVKVSEEVLTVSEGKVPDKKFKIGDFIKNIGEKILGVNIFKHK